MHVLLHLRAEGRALRTCSEEMESSALQSDDTALFKLRQQASGSTCWASCPCTGILHVICLYCGAGLK